MTVRGRTGAGCIGALAALLLLSGATAFGESRPPVVVTAGSVQTYRAAVQRFADRSALAVPSHSADFRTAIGDALDYSNIFDVVDPRAYLAPDTTASLGGRPNLVCTDWSSIGADALVEGEIEVDASRFTVEFRVWDTSRCSRLLQRRYRNDASEDPAILAKRIADDVVQAFTGQRGVAAIKTFGHHLFQSSATFIGILGLFEFFITKNNQHLIDRSLDRFGC